jgi:hypothetical protein
MRFILLTKRSHFNGGYYVGPINTNGKKPDKLGTRAYSLQVNIGVEIESIAKFFGLFAKAPHLETKKVKQKKDIGAALRRRAKKPAIFWRESRITNKRNCRGSQDFLQ